MRKMVQWCILVVAASLAGCSGGCSVPEAYVQADRATFNALAPEYLRYVEADPALDLEARQRRIDLVQTWDLRIRKAEGVQ